MSTYCIECHQGKESKGETDLSLALLRNPEEDFELWESAAARISAGEMPPNEAKQPSEKEKQEFLDWYQKTFVDSVQAHPGFFEPRRLCATEYRNTLNSLLGFDLEVSVIEAEQTVTEKSLVMKLLQIDPPGQSGFRNDTHGNPLTSLLWDQYSFIADAALEELFSVKRRTHLQQTVGEISPSGLSAKQVEALLQSLAPRIQRRPLSQQQLVEITARVADSVDIESAIKVELKSLLMSPGFMFRGLLMDKAPGTQQRVDTFELAERLSYFIWGDMPDAELFECASNGTLHDAKVLAQQVDRMLNSPKSRNLSDDFSVQWLALAEIANQNNNPPQAEALRSQPRDFFHYLITEDRPLIELIDSKIAFVNPFTAKYYGQDRKQMEHYRKPKGIEVEIVPNQQIALVHTTERGGILTMPGVLEMNAGPIQRGTWILERILGEDLPEPPPDAGQIPARVKDSTLTFRQRFEQHRSKETCAICHNKIDPLGFALERYVGPNYKKDPKIDTSGQLPSGEQFADFQELKQILVTSQRERVIRNIVENMLAYALCRKLELYDKPTIDEMVNKLNHSNGTYRELVQLIAASLPFQQTYVRE